MSDSNKDINAELFNAVKNGEIDKVKSLISDGADVNASDGWFIPLYWAAKNHHFNLVEVLLDNGAEFIIPVSHAGRERHVHDRYQKIETEHCKNFLHLAARLGNLEEVKNLLRKGAEIDEINDKRQTPFDLAVDEEIKDLLQSVKEANDKLLEAAKSGNIGDIENLLNEEGKAQVNATDQDGWTPLHWAAESGRKEIVVALINAEAKVDAQGEHEETSLHLAAENGHKDVVEFLLSKKGDVNATDQDGKTPLDLTTND
jgi:ankyrin repeat protein